MRDHGLRGDFPYREPVAYEDILTEAPPEPALTGLSEEECTQRIKGAWFGRCAAVVLGKPLEMQLDRRRIQEYLQSVNAYPMESRVPYRSEKLNVTTRDDCLPSTLGNVNYVQPDDDVHYTILALLLA